MKTYINMSKAFLAYWFVMLTPSWVWSRHETLIDLTWWWGHRPKDIPVKKWFSPDFEWED